MTTYSYDLNADFLNGIDSYCLHKTIEDYGFSSILVGVNISYDDEEVNIKFDGSIESNEQNDLDTIIANHDPDNCEEESDIGNVIGAAGYAVSEVQSSTNSRSPIRKLRLAIVDLPEGTYRIGWYYEWASSSSSSDFRARIQLNDTTDLMYQSQEAKDPGTDQSMPLCGFSYQELESGDHNIDLDYWHESSTAYIQKARLEIWRVL